MPPIAAASRRTALKIVLFIASAVFAGVIAWLIYGESDAAIELFCCSFTCAIPIFAILSWVLRKRGKLGFVLPLMALPMLFTLILANILYERTPQYMFKTYVADPIPAGVINVQGRYLTEFIFMDAVITFQASPEAIETIIAENQLEKSDFNHAPDRDLSEHYWKGNWINYERGLYDSGGGLDGYIRMWVDREQSIVVFRYVMGS